MEQIKDNQWRSKFGEYLRWYLYAPEDRDTVSQADVAKTFADNCDNGGWDTEHENIACILYLQDEASKQRLHSYNDLKRFVQDHFEDEIIITCKPEKFNDAHAFEVDSIKIELQAICEPFNDDEFNFDGTEV